MGAEYAVYAKGARYAHTQGPGPGPGAAGVAHAVTGISRWAHGHGAQMQGTYTQCAHTRYMRTPGLSVVARIKCRREERMSSRGGGVVAGSGCRRGEWVSSRGAGFVAGSYRREERVSAFGIV